MIILIACIALVCTFVGGLFALRLRDKLHLVLGFSAGAVLSVAFFDLIPEALELGATWYTGKTILSFVALGFLVYLILDRTLFFHTHSHEDDDECEQDNHVEEAIVKPRGILGATSMSIHSFLDGMMIGLSFQVSTEVGIIVAIAVLVHDFSDGINVVNMILKNGGTIKHAFRWLVLDAIAPVLGIIVTIFFTLPIQRLSILMALFAGFFLYISASDLIPESHHAHPKLLTSVMTIVGAGVMFMAISVI